MTVLEEVRDLLNHRKGEVVCDDCIADKLKLTVRQHANHKTNILKNERGFNRRKGTCPVCKGNKLVIGSA
jgi:Zn finger protein HypA/HybF involved in hydrogenase expression